MTGDVHRAGDRYGTYPVEWGLPPGSAYSPARESWVRAQIRKHTAWSPQDALDWLARRQYAEGYRRRSGGDSG